MQVNRIPWKRERKDKNSRRGRRGDRIPCGLQKPPNPRSFIPERQGEAYCGFWTRGRCSTVAPPSQHLECLFRERLGRARRRRGGVGGLWSWIVQGRLGIGGRGAGGLVGLSRGWSHTCIASPRSRWSTAGTGPAMRTLLGGNKLCAPSCPPTRWGTASRPRPAQARGPPGQRTPCANVCFPCQGSIRGRILSGHPNRCLEQSSKAHRGKQEPSRMAKVPTSGRIVFNVVEIIRWSCRVGTNCFKCSLMFKLHWVCKVQTVWSDLAHPLWTQR